MFGVTHRRVFDGWRMIADKAMTVAAIERRNRRSRVIASQPDMTVPQLCSASLLAEGTALRDASVGRNVDRAAQLFVAREGAGEENLAAGIPLFFLAFLGNSWKPYF